MKGPLQAFAALLVFALCSCVGGGEFVPGEVGGDGDVGGSPDGGGGPVGGVDSEQAGSEDGLGPAGPLDVAKADVTGGEVGTSDGLAGDSGADAEGADDVQAPLDAEQPDVGPDGGSDTGPVGPFVATPGVFVGASSGGGLVIRASGAARAVVGTSSGGGLRVRASR